MSRFTREFRDEFPNKVARHFDKYVEYVNPVPFCPLEDIYRQAFTPDEWDCLNTLMERSIGRRTLHRDGSFELLLPGKKGVASFQRNRVTFQFPDKRKRPGIEIEFDELPDSTQANINTWLKTAVGYRKLRRELFARVKALLDWGWERNQSYDHYRGCWRGGPTPGQGCNTVGQVNRIWPELLAFFPPEMIARVRNAHVKSRLPDYILYRGKNLSPQQFMVKAPLWHDIDETEAYTHEEMTFVRRRLEAINHVLVQMSLLKDVPHDDNYPEITLA